MYIEEGKRLNMFIERICKMTQKKFAETVTEANLKANPDGKVFNRSDITRYISGQMAMPWSLLKVMRKLWKLNYEWMFEGTGPMQVDKANDRKMANDVTEILATVLVLEGALTSLRKDVKGLAGDFYAFKHESAK